MVAITAIAGTLASVASSVGKSMAPVAKVKKSSWKAMKSGFDSVKSAASGGFGFMDAIKKGMEALKIIFLPLTILSNLFAGTLKQALMPAVTRIMEVMTNENFINSITNIAESIAAFLVPILLILVGVFESLGPIIEEYTAGMLDLWTVLGDSLMPLIPLISTAFQALTPILMLVIKAMRFVINIISGFIVAFRGAFQAGIDFVTGLLDAFVVIVKSVVNGVIWLLNTFLDLLNLIPGVNFTKLDYLHSGGMVPQTGAYWLKEGERVSTRQDNGGRGGINININLSGGIITDEFGMSTLIDKIKREVWRVT